LIAKLVEKFDFETEKSWEWFKSEKGGRYRADIYFEIEDKKIVIEYNGEQHYLKVGQKDFFGGVVEVDPRIKDAHRAKLLRKNGIKLITIPCFVKDKKQTLYKKLKKYGIEL